MNAFEYLRQECRKMPKTKTLKYSKFKAQAYLFKYPTDVASIMFKLRAKSVDCKGNRKSSYPDLICRLCKNADEVQEHVINCPSIRHDEDESDIIKVINEDILIDDVIVHNICTRYIEFKKKVNISDDDAN